MRNAVSSLFVNDIVRCFDPVSLLVMVDAKTLKHYQVVFYESTDYEQRNFYVMYR